MFTPESLKRQGELIRALQKKLAEREQELADAKWVLQQYLLSPSWRLTSPLRWLMRSFRALAGRPRPSESIARPEAVPAGERILPEEARLALDLKKVLTAFHRTALENFLVSNSLLELPCSPEPEVSIILVLFNRAELTFACLQSIMETRGEELEIIVVDNLSTDETPLLLDRLRGARIIRNSENVNFLAAVNQAADQARGRHILLLNNDAQLLPGAIRAALDTIGSAPGIGAVGGRIVLMDGTLQEAGSIVWKDGSCLGYGRGDTPFAPQYAFRRDVDYCSGAFLLTPRAVWKELGGFDESFRPAYYEETDYCMRLWKHGLRVVYEPEAAILHYEFGSHQSSITAIEMQAAHQRIFAERHSATLDRHETADANRILHARMKHRGNRVLFIDDRAPHLWLGSGFPRAHAIIRAFLKHGSFVTMFPTTAPGEDWNAIYSDIPREVEVMAGVGWEMLELFLESRKGYYDAIFISRPHNMEFLQPILAAHPRWFDAVRIIYDAESLFTHRQAGRRKLEGSPMSDGEFLETVKGEIRLAVGADCIVCVSEHEADTFRHHGIHRLSILGHSLKPAPTTSTFNERNGILFVGAVHEETSPNAESLVWFLTEVFPLIQERLGPGITFTIAGVNKSQRVRELATGPVRIAGHFRDLTSLYSSARVFVAPTRFAAGIPHKVHEAAAQGLPVVATPLLAAQLSWTSRELAIAGTAEDFAACTVELYTSSESWESVRNAALRRIVTECSPAEFDRRMGEILTEGINPDRSSLSRFANVGMDR